MSDPASDTRTCGELSCEECNTRTEALQAEIDRLKSRIVKQQQGWKDCDAWWKREHDGVLAERDSLKELLREAVIVMEGAPWSCYYSRLVEFLARPEIAALTQTEEQGK